MVIKIYKIQQYREKPLIEIQGYVSEFLINNVPWRQFANSNT
jgi:hypothetical protein